MSYKKILIPIDFSECSINALKYAINLAKSTEAKLALLHAYHVPIPMAEAGLTIDPNLAEEFVQEGEEKMNKLFKQFPELDKLANSYSIKMAFASEAIVAHAEETNADLIIMGTHGASNAFDEMVGSNTLHVIKKCHIPVLAVPVNYTGEKVSEILFSYDYHSVKNKKIIQPLIDFVLAFGAKLHIIHVADRVEALSSHEVDEARILEQYLKGIPHNYHMIEDEHVERGILDYIASNSVDVLAVMPRKHTLFQRLFQSSVTKQLVHHSSIPLLAFPEGK